MKRIAGTDKERLVRLVRSRERKRIRRKRIRRFSRLLASATEIVVHAPEDMSFSRNYEKTINFLDKMREVALYSTRKVYIDLVPVRNISVPAAVVLAAEFHRWSILQKARLRPRSISKWSPRLRSLLSDLGVFELLGIPAFKGKRILTDNITLTKMRSGVRAEGAKLNALQRDFSQIVSGFTRNPELYAGLHEAAENVVSHAYPSDIELPFRSAGHRWWGVGCLQPTNENLRFFIFDQGAGIPATLPKCDWFEQLRSFITDNLGGVFSDHGKLIRAALETGRTQTMLAHRGKGLARMCQIVRSAPDSYIRILSGKGEVVLRSDGTIEDTTRTSHIGGTLIEWSIPADVFRESDDYDERT